MSKHPGNRTNETLANLIHVCRADSCALNLLNRRGSRLSQTVQSSVKHQKGWIARNQMLLPNLRAPATIIEQWTKGLFDDFQVFQGYPACRVGHVCDPGPAAFNALYPYNLALHHSHFTCHVVLLCDRSLTVYLDTLLRDPAPLPTLAFTEHPTGPFFVSSLHHLQRVARIHGQRIRILCLVAGNDQRHCSRIDLL